MKLSSLLIGFAISAIILTLFNVLVLKKHKAIYMSFLQNFCGVWFIFSGFVKAVDPLGTAYKMQQYFAEFETTFQHTWFKWLSPLFPILGYYSTGFSIFMIVLEIMLGILLVIGGWKRFTGVAFLLIIVFFTILTGFTYLTGYVPNGVNFFEFSKWSHYETTNMRVTDCGCFGDFLKLEPKVSFFKDLFLLIPACLFIIRIRDKHTLFSSKVNNVIIIVSTIACLFYCFNNFYFDIPSIDFRPFKEGVNIREKKKAEEEAMTNVKITAYKLKNIKTGDVINVPYDKYLSNYKDYPKTEWEILDQVKTEPTVAHTKVSDFYMTDMKGEDVTETFLNDKSNSIMVSAYEFKVKEIKEKTTMVADSIFKYDTVKVESKITAINKNFVKMGTKKLSQKEYIWDEKYLDTYKNIIIPFLSEASKKGVHCFLLCTGFEDEIADFKAKTGFNFDIYKSDDLVIKTIIRSNPGITLWHDGTIIKHYHYKKLPSFEEVSKSYIK